MQALVGHKQFLERNPGNNQMAIADLRFRGAPIDDLCLDFTLPGYPDYILKGGGENIMVTTQHCCSYCYFLHHLVFDELLIIAASRLISTIWKSMLL